MRISLAAVLIGLGAAGVCEAARAKEAPLKTVTRKGFASFKVAKEWRVVEDWKSDTPNALVEFIDAAAGPLQIQVTNYPLGNKLYTDQAAWTAQLLKPNLEFEKSVSSKTVTLDGRDAILYHVELLDMLWVTARMGQKRKMHKDLIAADYAGGFAVVSFSSPEKVYEARRKDFERFLTHLKLLVPSTGSPAPVPSPK